MKLTSINDNIVQYIDGLLKVVIWLLFCSNVALFYFLIKNMDNYSGWLNILVILLGGLYLIGAIIALFITALKEIKKNKLINQIKKAIINHQIRLDDIKHIALNNKTGLFPRIDMFDILNILYTDSITNNNELSVHKKLIKSYITQYEQESPFDNIPDNIYTYLAQCQSKDNQLTRLLAKEIKHILGLNNKQAKRQLFYTALGALFGFTGVVFALYNLLQ